LDELFLFRPCRATEIVIGDNGVLWWDVKNPLILINHDRNNRCKPIGGDDVSEKEVSWNLDEPVDGRLYLSKFCASQLPVKRALDYEDDDIHN